MYSHPNHKKTNTLIDYISERQKFFGLEILTLGKQKVGKKGTRVLCFCAIYCIFNTLNIQNCVSNDSFTPEFRASSKAAPDVYLPTMLTKFKKNHKIDFSPVA